MGDAILLLWQAGLLVFWFWLGSFIAENKRITDQWSVEWLNRTTRLLAVPAFALFLALAFGSNVGDEAIYSAPDLSRSEFEEVKRHHQAVWLARGFAGFCGAIYKNVFQRGRN